MHGQAIPVGPRIGVNWIILGISGLGWIGLEIWLDGFPPRDLVPMSLGLALPTLAVLRYVWVCMSWRTVLDTGRGLVVADRSGANEYLDEDVVTTALCTNRDFEHGRPTSTTTRTFDIWVEPAGGAQGRKIHMVNTIAQGAADPLADLIARLQARIVEQARDALAQGRSIHGEQWTASNARLSYESGTRAQVIEMNQIMWLRESDGRICIWVDDDEQPRLRIPLTSANAWLLKSIIGEIVCHRDRNSTASPTGLGRLLFVRRPTLLVRWVRRGGLCMTAAAAICETVSITLNSDLLVLASVVIGAAGPGLFLAAGKYSKTLYCYETGLAVRSLLSRKSLRYTQVAWYSEKAVAHVTNHGYEGTTVDLEFVGLPAVDGATVQYSTKYYNEDLELENLRDQVSRVIALRMRAELLRQQVTSWTSAVKFVPDGLEVKRGLFTGAGTELIAFDQIERYELTAGQMRLFTIDTPRGRPMLTMPSWTENFYPGWTLLHILCPRPGLS
jgi:hypothetical protein